jgi:hypothetical protein
MNPNERNAVWILLLVAGGLVFLLAVGFLVFVCAFLIIDGGVGRVVGIAGLVGLTLALLSGIRSWIRKN